MSSAWDTLQREITECERCPRLRAHCLEVARTRRPMYRDQEYWGRPVPGFGDPRARIVVVGLAPAAHGANRTGRMFTGDRSGEWLYGGLHRAGLSNRAEAIRRDDGLRLRGVFITAPCRCAPPSNRPTREELGRCAPFLDRELELLDRVRVMIALGKIAWDAVLRTAKAVDPDRVPRPRPSFAHGAETTIAVRPGKPPIRLLGSYHVSQQNTQTGRLTRPMFDQVLRRATNLAAIGSTPNSLARRRPQA